MEKRNVGRPKAIINYKLAEELASIFCTQEEIANIIGRGLRTLQQDAEFMRIYKNGQDNAKSSLRRAQWKTAQNGNVSMQIWLGKQYLGQREPSVVDSDGKEWNVNIINDLGGAGGADKTK